MPELFIIYGYKGLGPFAVYVIQSNGFRLYTKKFWFSVDGNDL